MTDPRDLIGRTIDRIPTPAPLVELDVLDANLKRMSDYFAGRHAKLRPHFKSHKCVTLARRQIDAGNAVGITCAKLSEAEVLVAGGVEDVLVANQVVGADKAARLAALNKTALVRSAVDSAANVAELAEAARAAGVTIGVLVETDIGMGRCGVGPGEPTVALARRVADADGLRFDGLQGYEGHLVTKPDKAERAEATRAAMQLLFDTRDACAAAGLPCAILSGGGTGTYDITGDLDGMDEVQAGTYALMDCYYHQVRPEFACAESVLATIVSATDGRAVADVGLKGLGSDFGPPQVLGHPEAAPRRSAEEHTVIDGLAARVGERIRLIASHGCTTNNLHRRLWVVRDGVVLDVWPIEGSGKLE